MNKRPPTILQIIPRLDTGGAERTTVEITEALVASGARALVATEGGRLAGDISRAGGRLVSLPVATKNPWSIYRNAARLAQLIEREGIDLLHARSRAPAWSALIAARRTKRPFVTTYHGAYNEEGPVKRAYNSVMARADIVIANSKYTADLIRARYHTPEERLVVIYRGIDDAIFDPDTVTEARVTALRDGWRISPANKVVLLAARLTEWKGQRVLIEAARELAAAGSLPANTTIVLAGDPQGRSGYESALHSAIANAGLVEQFRIVGHVTDIAAAFFLSHVAVVASTDPEAFGRAAAESQAMQCPVIATRIGAPPETVISMPEHPENQRTGWLIPPADPAALAKALAEALSLSPNDRASLGERARQHVMARFSLDAMKTDTLAVYDRLLGTDLAGRPEV